MNALACRSLRVEIDGRALLDDVSLSVAPGEWVCIVEKKDGREEMEVRIEVKREASSRDGLKDKLEKRLREDLGVAVQVALAEQGSLEELANTGGREGKARRLVDRRPGYSK